MRSRARLGLLAAPFILAAAGGRRAMSQPAAAPRSGGAIVSVLPGDPVATNGVTTTLAGDQLVANTLYEGLVRVAASGGIRPGLAKSWTISPDGLTYEFELQRTAWHDGHDFTSADAKFSLLEVSRKYASLFTTAGNLIQSIDTPAPTALRINLSKPYGPFLRALAAHSGGAILPEHLIRGRDFVTNPVLSTEPVGTGAFKLAEWKRGDYLRVVRNPGYWNPGHPYLDEIVFKIIPQASSRVQALRAGEVDFIHSGFLSNSDVPVISRDPALKVVPTTFPPSLDFLFVNYRNPVLANRDVRRALMMATNRNFIVATVFNGHAVPSPGPFPSQIAWAYNKDTNYNTLYPFNPAEANAALDAAGQPRGADGTRFRVGLTYDGSSADSAKLAQGVQAMWRTVGVVVTPQPLDRATITQRVFVDRDFDLSFWGYNSYGDPAVGITRIYDSAFDGKPFGNPSGYRNPAVEALFAQASSATTMEERGAIYRRAQALLAPEVPALVLTAKEPSDAAKVAVSGVWEMEGYGDWAGAWLAA